MAGIPEPEGFWERWHSGQQTEADEFFARMMYGMGPLSAEDRALSDAVKQAANGRTVIVNARLDKHGRIVSPDPFYVSCFLGEEVQP